MRTGGPGAPFMAADAKWDYCALRALRLSCFPSPPGASAPRPSSGSVRRDDVALPGTTRSEAGPSPRGDVTRCRVARSALATFLQLAWTLSSSLLPAVTRSSFLSPFVVPVAARIRLHDFKLNSTPRSVYLRHCTSRMKAAPTGPTASRHASP